MKFYILVLAGVAAISQATAAAETKIPMVGQAPDGSTIEEVVPSSVYTERLQTAVTGVEKSTIVALNKRSESSKSWNLRTVVVGIGVNAEVKLGPIIKFGALPRFRVGFSNAKEPSIP